MPSDGQSERTQRWDDIEYAGPRKLAATVQRTTIEVDRHPGNDSFAACCNAATRTILALAEEES